MMYKVICNDEFIFKHNSKIKNFNYTPENWRLVYQKEKNNFRNIEVLITEIFLIKIY